MEFEDSRNALYCDPNAYIQKNNKETKGAKKVVFSEPYESLPNYYLNNNFKKKDCDCVCNVNKSKNHKPENRSNPNFDVKNFLPFLSSINKGVDFSNIGGILSKLNIGEGGLSSILKNPNIITSVLSLFKSDLFSKKQTEKKEVKSTEFLIKDYTKVD